LGASQYLEKKALNLHVDPNTDKILKYIELIKLLGFEEKSMIIPKIKEILEKYC
jgi:hypothetical protein